MTGLSTRGTFVTMQQDGIAYQAALCVDRQIQRFVHVYVILPSHKINHIFRQLIYPGQ